MGRETKRGQISKIRKYNFEPKTHHITINFFFLTNPTVRVIQQLGGNSIQTNSDISDVLRHIIKTLSKTPSGISCSALVTLLRKKILKKTGFFREES